MKFSITLLALLSAGFITIGTQQASSAVVYCRYIDYPVGCVVKPGVRLVARPVARAAVATPGRPMNRGGPVDRVGRR